jgi:thymidylate synthase
MSNKLDKQYTALLQDILDNGVKKETRNGGTISVFGRQIRHKISEGFPLLTTKKMHWKSIVTELLWFLRGDTNIKYLVDNNCHIWDGDAYKNYLKNFTPPVCPPHLDVQPSYYEPLSKEQFINGIKTNDEFAKKWGELGPVYGKQWRSWKSFEHEYGEDENGDGFIGMWKGKEKIDQIANLINDLKTNPDSRRLMVNAWNVGEIDQMVLPPCHYGFQLYTRELSWEERSKLLDVTQGPWDSIVAIGTAMDKQNLPKRAISLMFNMRSCDFFLGFPFNIASYGLLLMMIADEVNMVPDELIGNLGDTHLYLNHIEQAKEQIGRELTLEERIDLIKENKEILVKLDAFSSNDEIMRLCDKHLITKRTREPYPLPKVVVQDGIYCSSTNDVILLDYQSHPAIKAPLSN